MLPGEFLLVEGGCLLRDGGRFTGVGWADKGGWAENCILCRHQDELKVAVLVLSVWTLNRRRVLGEETMSVLYGRIVQFPRMLG